MGMRRRRRRRSWRRSRIGGGGSRKRRGIEEENGNEREEAVQWFTFIFTILFISSKNLLNPHILLNSFSIRLAITGVTRPFRPLEHRANYTHYQKLLAIQSTIKYPSLTSFSLLSSPNAPSLHLLRQQNVVR